MGVGVSTGQRGRYRLSERLKLCYHSFVAVVGDAKRPRALRLRPLCLCGLGLFGVGHWQASKMALDARGMALSALSGHLGLATGIWLLVQAVGLVQTPDPLAVLVTRLALAALPFLEGHQGDSQVAGEGAEAASARVRACA